MRFVILLGLMVGLVSPARAQAGSCEIGTAQRFLENHLLRASVFNTGGLFFGGSIPSGDGYLIPKQDSTSTMMAASFWLGGHVDGELRVSGGRYGNHTFWPGPLEDAASPPTDCSAYDRIFVVSRDDIRRYYETGVPTDDLRDWPHQLGAPVLDGDGDSTNYDLRAGDQPDLIGDVAAWWVMNDAGNEHPGGGSTPPMGVEVRVLVFTYGANGIARSPALTATTFYRYEIVNRGGRPIEDLYAAIWADGNLGDLADDYMGTDTLRNLIYVYNGDDEDASYGVAPPAQGVQVLLGPVGLANGRDDDFDGRIDEEEERLGMTAGTRVVWAGSDQISAWSGWAKYRVMQGVWPNGTPVTAFGQGYNSNGPVTPFFFSGDPTTYSFWSEMNLDGFGAQALPSDRLMAAATGPFRLDPGATETMMYAFPYARGTSHLHSVAELRRVADVLQTLSSNGDFDGSDPGEYGVPPIGFSRLAVSSVRPNPSSGAAEVALLLPAEARVRATVVDVLGRQLEVVVDGDLPEGDHALTIPDGLAPGTYLLRVRVEPGGEETLTFTVAR